MLLVLRDKIQYGLKQIYCPYLEKNDSKYIFYQLKLEVWLTENIMNIWIFYSNDNLKYRDGLKFGFLELRTKN